ncbi:MAG: MFS transporter [Chloroflexota bacterium]|nr:MFS transporter [Chloroflexota bacterium]
MNTTLRKTYYGWWVVAAASSISFANAATAISILTVFVVPMSQEFGWNRTEVAGATSLGAVLGAGLAPFTGRAVDRFGARVTLVAGGLIVVAGCLYLSSAQALAGFYAAFTAVRIADQGLIQVSASVTAGKWFARYRGRATGLVMLGNAGGVIVMAPLVQIVISAWDWRAAWVMLAGVMLVVGAVPALLLVRRQPEDLGLRVDGDGISAATAGSEASAADPDVDLSMIFRTPSFWLILVSLFLVATATSGIGLHLAPHLTQQGLSAGAAVAAISVMSISGALAALACGLLAERAPPRLLLVMGYLLAAASMWVLMRADDLPETYLFAVMQGIVGAGINTLAPILWADYYGRRSLGSIFGVSRAAQVVGFAVGPLASAVVYDRTGDYQGAFLALAAVALLATVLLAAARRPRV